MRAFVTGGGGFVGGFLRAHLIDCGDEVFDPFVDVTDAGALADALADAQPDAVYHLAGQADVAKSWTDPASTFAVNAVGTLNLITAVTHQDRPPRTIIVSSGEVYGRVSPDEIPVREDRLVRPASPYGASKASAELVALQAFFGRGVPVIVARPFNHIGPGQSEAFVVSAIARQIAEAERDGGSELRVGNLAAKRDFTDVRDVVRAYRACVERGTPGTTYNVCSGVAVPISDLVERMAAMADRPLSVVVDPDRFRPSDVPEIRGDNTRLRTDTGWSPTHSLDEALAATVAWWRERLAVAG